MPRRARLTDITVPDFGLPRVQPDLPPEITRARFARLMDAARAQGFDAVAIYADREHSANLAWATGFDPRFEEALLVAIPGRDPAILTGPENLGLAALTPVGAEAVLFESFGLLGQDRRLVRPLADLLAGAGLAKGHRIGVIGWKYFLPSETPQPETRIDIPAYVSQELAAFGPLANATALLMHPATGLRTVLEIEDLARMEFTAVHASACISRVLAGLHPGMTEFEAAALMRPIGLPLACHTMLSAGPRARFGLLSPSGREIGHGDPMTMAFGYQGALTARAGFVTEDESGLPDGAKDYVDRLVIPYFQAAAEWYETIDIGVPGGEIDARMHALIDSDVARLSLNPGHLIHLDEWLSTPVYPGSTDRFRSGQAVQIDMIPVTGSAYFTTNIEDGIALLDARTRAAFAERFPEAQGRIDARRVFMEDVLGIRPKPSVLPLSNLCGVLSPYLLAPSRVLVMT